MHSNTKPDLPNLLDLRVDHRPDGLPDGVLPPLYEAAAGALEICLTCDDTPADDPAAELASLIAQAESDTLTGTSIAIRRQRRDRALAIISELPAGTPGRRRKGEAAGPSRNRALAAAGVKKGRATAAPPKFAPPKGPIKVAPKPKSDPTKHPLVEFLESAERLIRTPPDATFDMLAELAGTLQMDWVWNACHGLQAWLEAFSELGESAESAELESAHVS